MDFFEIPVTYNQKELTFKARSVRFGYINHILVSIDDTQLTIERDEEGNFRALVDVESMKERTIDLGLIKALVGVLQSL